VASLPAIVEGGTFAVEVPVDSETTTLTVNAADVATGATVTQTIGVLVQQELTPAESRFTALPMAGLAPHVVRFSINAGEGAHVTLDLDGDGALEFDGARLDGLPFVYARPGIYVPTVRVMTAGGELLTHRTIVEVYDRARLDARLQSAWSGFKQALQTGSVPAIASFIHGHRRAGWQEYLGRLIAGDLAAEANLLTTIELVQVGRGGAEYEMLREEDGRIFSYPIVFVADVDGRWRLWQF
jgi:hypothetical protein